MYSVLAAEVTRPDKIFVLTNERARPVGSIKKWSSHPKEYSMNTPHLFLSIDEAIKGFEEHYSFTYKGPTVRGEYIAWIGPYVDPVLDYSVLDNINTGKFKIYRYVNGTLDPLGQGEGNLLSLQNKLAILSQVTKYNTVGYILNTVYFIGI